MNLQLDDTIAALGSPPGPAARGIVRMSGPDLCLNLDPLFDPEEPARWQSLRAAGRHAGTFRMGASKVPLPVAVYLWPNRRSYTGQPMAEVHTVGSPPLLEAVLSALFAVGVRPARPGEFTLRAFLAGRIDLMQAEAVLGVVDALDHEELHSALRQLAGGISGRMAAVRDDLLNLLADLEAGLDFVEEDIEFIERRELIERVTKARDDLSTLLLQATDRMQSTGRPRVVLAGLPNAGKSTLFNALSRRPAALVSEIQGTTRDYLSAQLDWQGLAIELIDTAGWDSATNALMQQTQTSRHNQLLRSDLIVWCTASDVDATHLQAEARLLRALKQPERLVVHIETKCDLPSAGRQHSSLRVSAVSGTGMQALQDAIVAKLTDAHPGSRQLIGSTASRCRESLMSTVDALEQARTCAERNVGEEIVAIEVREALEHLGRILGVVYTDDILDRIFSRFCIGK